MFKTHLALPLSFSFRIYLLMSLVLMGASAFSIKAHASVLWTNSSTGGQCTGFSPSALSGCLLNIAKSNVYGCGSQCAYTSTTIVDSTSAWVYFKNQNGNPIMGFWVTKTGNCSFGSTFDLATGECQGAPKNAGQASCPNIAGTNPINTGIGHKFQQEIDYTNGALSFQRTYNSDGLNRPVIAGNGWTTNYDIAIKVSPSNASIKTVLRPDGKQYTFTLSNGVWIPGADISSTLTLLPSGGWQYKNSENNDEIENYDANGNLLSITARNGYTKTLTYSTATSSYILDANGNPTSTPLPAGILINVTDSFGRQLSFGYDIKNHQVKMLDPNGEAYLYGYDTSGNLVSIKYPDGNTRTYVYNESANTSGANLPNALTGVLDENNQRFATWKYDTQGRAISSEHNLPNNQTAEKTSITYTTNSNGNITSAVITDALNTTRTYSFTTVLGVTKNTGITQPCSSGCGTNSATNYDSNSNITSKTDFNGNQTTYQYNLARNLETSRTEAYGTAQARTITTQWHATYRLPTLISEPGKTTSFSYDTAGNLLSKTITDTALNKSRTWSWTYNSLGQVLTANGPRTDVTDITTYTYYTSASSTAGSVRSVGDLATVTNALNQVTSITNYDLNGRPLTITDPNGIITTLTYTPRGWLKTKTINGAQTTSYDYDNVGQLTKVTLPDNSYLSYTYDTAHRLTDIADNAGNKIHYTLDAMGNRTQEDTKDPSNNILKTRSRVFDALNRLQKDIGGTSPSTQITQYGYDNVGNLKTITDPLNHLTTNGYDALNRLITVTDPANGASTTTYNALDQTTQIKDPRLVSTNYTINALGDVTLTQSPDSGNTNNIYDPAGNVTQKTDARGIVANYTYDALNRITAITYPASTAENVSFTYDSTANGNKGKGKLTGYSNNGGATVLNYDAYGNVSQQTDMIGSQIYVTAWQYNNTNRISQFTYPSGRIVIYIRNASGQIAQIQTKDTSTSAAVTLISSASYYPFGPLSTLAFANGVTTTTQLNLDYRVSRLTTNSIPAWYFIYSRDAANNIIGMADQISTYSKTLGRDNLNRVTSDVNNTGTWTYTFDASGNRTNRVNTSTQTQTYATASNRMTNNGSAAQTFDANGNLITNSTKTYTYNSANRLNTYKLSGVIKAQMQYNAMGQRTAKLQVTKPMHFHYDQSGRFIGSTAFNSDGTLYQRYEWIYLDDMPIAQVLTNYGANNTVSSRRTTYIHADHLNTPRAMTDSTKKIVWRWDGDAFGKTAPNQNPDGDSVTDILNLRFAGQHYDVETGFYYNINRDYDPDNGRYTLQADPLGLNGGSWSLYSYVSGDPISLVDPLGLTQCDIDAAYDIAKRFYPKLVFGEGSPKVDLPKDGGELGHSSLRNQGERKNIPGRDGLIHLNKKYLDCLSEDQAIDLLDTLIHESLHFTRPPSLQIDPEYDHNYIYPEAARKTNAASIQFLLQRSKCKCECK